MTTQVNAREYAEYEPTLNYLRDPTLIRWRQRLENLSSSAVLVRQATADGPDGRRLWDLQLMCEPISVRSVTENVAMITERLVLFAEMDDVHVGFCVSFPGSEKSDPLFVQFVGVAPSAKRKGAALALLTAAAAREPFRDIALATQETNVAARALNERFAESIGACIRRVALGTYRDRDLRIQRGLGYRAWLIQRSQSKS